MNFVERINHVEGCRPRGHVLGQTLSLRIRQCRQRIDHRITGTQVRLHEHRAVFLPFVVQFVHVELADGLGRIVFAKCLALEERLADAGRSGHQRDRTKWAPRWVLVDLTSLLESPLQALVLGPIVVGQVREARGSVDQAGRQSTTARSDATASCRSTRLSRLGPPAGIPVHEPTQARPVSMQATTIRDSGAAMERSMDDETLVNLLFKSGCRRRYSINPPCPPLARGSSTGGWKRGMVLRSGNSASSLLGCRAAYKCCVFSGLARRGGSYLD